MKFSFGEVAAAIVVVFGPSAIRANDQLSAGSSSSTGIPCANDTVGWVDVAGDGCDWYELYDWVAPIMVTCTTEARAWRTITAASARAPA